MEPGNPHPLAGIPPNPHDLVTGDNRVLRHRQVPLNDMQIRSAHPTIFHVHKDLVFGGDRFFHLTQR
jgi:hypothetical protein